MPMEHIKLRDMIGRRYGRLTVVAIQKGPKSCVCKCSCGNEKLFEVRKDSLLSGNTKSCGCLHSEYSRINGAKAADVHRTHGMSGTRLFRIWSGMKRRCFDKKHHEFHRYGGRGIRVCDEWLDFSSFMEWAKTTGYNDEMTIDRIDVDGGYMPQNCRWMTRAEQSGLRANVKILTFNGESGNLSQLSKRFGLPAHTAYDRMNNGWSLERTLTEPIHTEKRNRCSK